MRFSMRYFMCFLALLLAMPLSLSPATAETWQAVKTEGLGFKIEMPGDPKVEEETVDLGDGQSAKMRTIQILSPQAIYDVTIADYPAGMAQSIGTDKVLDNARDGALANAPGPLKGESKVVFAGHPARELLVDMTMGMTLRSYIFLVQDRLYNIGAITKDGSERSADIEKYFASFALEGAGAAAKP